MSGLSPLDRAKIARSVAALLGAGWPAGRALAVTAGALPAGEMRTRLEALAGALQRGDVVAPEADPLLGLLARGEAAGSGALVSAARGFELDAHAQRAARAGLLYPAIGLVFCALLSFFGAYVIPVFTRAFDDFGSTLPAPTVAIITLAPVLKWAPLLPALALVFALVFWPRSSQRLPGARALRAGAALHTYAAALRSGLPLATALSWAGAGSAESLSDAPGVPLDEIERALLRRWHQTADPASAATALAAALDDDARSRAALFLRIVPLAAAGLMAILVGAIIIALYLPIFSITNTLQ